VRAVQVARFAQPGAVELREVPKPTRGLDQVLVDVSNVG
jgi:NADPH:quinone reductase-like Zn-dependent oxidoreductase